MRLYHPREVLEIFDPAPQHPWILSGNEAYARGLFEAGVQFVAMYPGTPVTEIGDIWAEYAAQSPHVFYELAINETVAFEAAVGACWTGVRAAVLMKHVGFNLIADPLHTIQYAGLDGGRQTGCVIICGGDPDIKSSTNAEDIRLFAWHAQIPVIEPSTIDECRTLVPLAFELSEQLQIPVLLYSSTRLHHASTIVRGSPPVHLQKPHEILRFEKHPAAFLNTLHGAQSNQTRLIARIQAVIEGKVEMNPACTGRMQGDTQAILNKVIVDSLTYDLKEDLAQLSQLDDQDILDTPPDDHPDLPPSDAPEQGDDSVDVRDRREEWEKSPFHAGQEAEFPDFVESPESDKAPALLHAPEHREFLAQWEKFDPTHHQATTPFITLGDGDTLLREPILVGFISCGVNSIYLEEMCHQLGKNLPRLHVTLTYPLAKPQILDFLEKYQPDALVVLEDLEPFLETQIKTILYDLDLSLPLLGKALFPRVGALSPDRIRETLANPFEFLDEHIYLEDLRHCLRTPPTALFDISNGIPLRDPTFCPGCAHRNVFYAIQRAAAQYQTKTGREAVFGGDIGCYTMGMSPPFQSMDWLICMGAGVGIMNGVAVMSNPAQQHFVAFIGDSTFFHSGIPAIINLAKHNANVLVCILDNEYTAMTGHQPSISTPVELRSTEYEQERPVAIKPLLEALGAFPISTFDGYTIPSMILGFERLFDQPGLKFALITAECALARGKRIRQTPRDPREPFTTTSVQIADYCTQCNECYEQLGCPAIQSWNNQYYIDATRCTADLCLSCVALCPNHAIKITRVTEYPTPTNRTPGGKPS